MIHQANAVVVLSSVEKEFVETLGEESKIQVLPNAVSVDELKNIKRGKAEKKAIIFLGRLHEGKGLKEIAEACKTLKNKNVDFRFRCYGTGEEKISFIRRMTEILNDDFYYGGVVSGGEKWRALSNADIFLLPSHYEGLPLALLEAMAAGCVAVASDVGSIGEIIENEKNGFLVEPRNASQIVEKLEFLLSGKIDWENLRQNAEKTIRERFSIKNYIKNLESIYRTIV